MRNWMLVAAVTVLFATAASAGELDAGEKAWVRQCVDGLAAPSGRVRASAERAIGSLGLDALPDVLASVGDRKTDVDWHSLARAVASMGAGATKSLEDLRASWPKYTQTRLGEVLDEVRAIEAKSEEAVRDSAARAADAPKSADDVEATVAAILETFRGTNSIRSPDPRDAELVKLGRPAIGALVKVLCDDDTKNEWAIRQKAKTALAAVVDRQDVPMLAKLVREGHVEVAAAFENLDSQEAVDAVADFVRRGLFDSSLDEMLKGKHAEPAVVAACCAWLDKPVYEGDMDFAVGQMAGIVGGEDLPGLPPGLPPDVAKQIGSKLGSDWTGRMTEAAPALARLLGGDLRIDARRRVASALVRLGDKAGIPALIDIMTSAKDSRLTDSNYDRHAAGQQLNEVSATDTYAGHDVHDKDLGYTRWDGNFIEAAREFRAWWGRSKDKLLFDAATRTWSTK